MTATLLGNGHWEYHKVCDPQTYFGFTYRITNTVTGQMYLGKKQYYSYSRGRRTKEMDWRNYAGSSKHVLADIAKYGKDKFSFQILKEWKTRGWLLYGESNIQHREGALTRRFPDGERAFYNGQILAVKHIPDPKHHPEECK